MSSAKCVSVFLFLSASSWILFVVGFGMRSRWNGDTEMVDNEMKPNYFCWWLFACVCPISMIGLFLYSIRTRDCIGVIALFMTCIVISAAGGVMSSNLNLIYEGRTDGSSWYVNSLKVEAAGAIAYVITQAMHMPYLFTVVTSHLNDHYLTTL